MRREKKVLWQFFIFKRKNGLQPTRPYRWLASWIRLGEEIVCIFTFACIRLHWSIDFWAWYHRIKWAEIPKNVSERQYGPSQK